MPIGSPNASRCVQHAWVKSNAATAWTAIESRSCGSLATSWANPVPSSQSKLATGDTDAIEKEFGGVLGVLANLVDTAAATTAFSTSLHHEQAYSLVPGRGIRFASQNHQIGVDAVSDEHLCPVAT